MEVKQKMPVFGITITKLILAIVIGIIGYGGSGALVIKAPHIYIKIGGGATGAIVTSFAEFWIFTQTFSF